MIIKPQKEFIMEACLVPLLTYFGCQGKSFLFPDASMLSLLFMLLVSGFVCCFQLLDTARCSSVPFIQQWKEYATEVLIHIQTSYLQLCGSWLILMLYLKDQEWPMLAASLDYRNLSDSIQLFDAVVLLESPEE